MSIIVTDRAKENLTSVMRNSGFNKPALRVMFAGFG